MLKDHVLIFFLFSELAAKYLSSGLILAGEGAGSFVVNMGPFPI